MKTEKSGLKKTAKEVKHYEEAIKKFKSAFDAVSVLGGMPEVKEHLAAKEAAAKQQNPEKEDPGLQRWTATPRYILTEEEQYQINNTLFQIESIARLLAHSADQNLAPDQDDMADVLLMAELVQEKIKVALKLMDKHPEEVKAA